MIVDCITVTTTPTPTTSMPPTTTSTTTSTSTAITTTSSTATVCAAFEGMTDEGTVIGTDDVTILVENEDGGTYSPSVQQLGSPFVVSPGANDVVITIAVQADKQIDVTRLVEPKNVNFFDVVVRYKNDTQKTIDTLLVIRHENIHIYCFSFCHFILKSQR